MSTADDDPLQLCSKTNKPHDVSGKLLDLYLENLEFDSTSNSFVMKHPIPDILCFKKGSSSIESTVDLSV